MKRTTHHQKPQRHVTVDGIRYSIESGRKLTGATRQSALKSPQSQTVASSELDTDAAEFMHPHRVSHPALPLPAQPKHQTHQKSVLSVILRSFREKQDRHAFDAALVMSILSPWFWLCAATPWAILSLTKSQNITIQQAYMLIRGLLTAPYIRIVISVIAIAAVAFILWLVRHILQLVSYAANIRRIDHRSVDAEEYGWQALAKSHRLISISAFELFSTMAFSSLTALVILRIFDSNLTQIKSLSIYVILVLFLLGVAIMAVHRTIVRIMLAVTNQSTAFLVVKSLGLTLRTLLRTLAFGLFWLLSATLAVGLLLALIWSTASYGQFTVGRHAIARAGLILLSTVLMYAAVVGFTLWSQGYWALVYHHIAHTSYKSAVSQLIITKPHQKARKSAIIQVITILVGLSIIATIALIALRTPAQRFFTSIHEKLPVNISEFVTRK